MKKSSIRSSLPRLLAVFVASILGAFEVSAKGVDRLFEGEEIVELRIELAIGDLRKQRGADLEWLEAKLFHIEGEAESVFDVSLRARGNFRRQKEICPFPSYWINFKKKQVKGTLFRGLDKVKVVAHCRGGWIEFDPYVYKEYLAYKTYNLLTDRSFRVRLARIVYKDPAKKHQWEDAELAFFIEPVERMEKRLGAEQIESRYVLPSEYDQESLCMAELFQYFVANTDFSYFASQDECCHNGKALAVREGDDERWVPVPYDFDMSGLVNPPYATVGRNLPIWKVTQRLYRGVDVEREVLERTIDRYLRKEAAVMALWESADSLDPEHREEAIEYIRDFFKVLKNGRLSKSELRDRSRSAAGIERTIEKRRADLAAEAGAEG